MGLKELVEAVRQVWEWAGYWGVAGGALGAFILGEWGSPWLGFEEVCSQVGPCTGQQTGLVTAIMVVAGILAGGVLGTAAREVFKVVSNRDE